MLGIASTTQGADTFTMREIEGGVKDAGSMERRRWCNITGRGFNRSLPAALAAYLNLLRI